MNTNFSTLGKSLQEIIILKLCAEIHGDLSLNSISKELSVLIEFNHALGRTSYKDYPLITQRIKYLEEREGEILKYIHQETGVTIDSTKTVLSKTLSCASQLIYPIEYLHLLY